MTDLAALGVTPAEVLAKLAASLGLAEVDETVTLDSLLDRFDPATLPRDPWVVT
jgi:glutamyl-tRNA synthetase